MGRVEITKYVYGLTMMQVCAVKDVTDEEILEVCNRLNPSGTEAGWTFVAREVDEKRMIFKNHLPVPCDDNPDRLHFLIVC